MTVLHLWEADSAVWSIPLPQRLLRQVLRFRLSEPTFLFLSCYLTDSHAGPFNRSSLQRAAISVRPALRRPMSLIVEPEGADGQVCDQRWLQLRSSTDETLHCPRESSWRRRQGNSNGFIFTISHLKLNIILDVIFTRLKIESSRKFSHPQCKRSEWSQMMFLEERVKIRGDIQLSWKHNFPGCVGTRARLS